MENRSPDPVTVLAMNIRRCEHCRTKLKEKLLKMPGVNSCDMDIENNLVVVMGRLDPMILAKDVAKLGKRVELLSYDKYPKNLQEKGERNKAKRSDQERVKKHKKRPCNSSFYKDERACMDSLCKIHPNFEPTQMDGEFGPYIHSGYNPGPYTHLDTCRAIYFLGQLQPIYQEDKLFTCSEL